jgi:hypothetical protein
VPFSDNNLGVGVSRTEKIMSNDSGKLINNFSVVIVLTMVVFQACL